LRRTLLDWDRRLGKTPAGHKAGLLDSLHEGSSGRRPAQPKLKKGFSRI
jgi:hypothetical protein